MPLGALRLSTNLSAAKASRGYDPKRENQVLSTRRCSGEPKPL